MPWERHGSGGAVVYEPELNSIDSQHIKNGAVTFSKLGTWPSFSGFWTFSSMQDDYSNRFYASSWSAYNDPLSMGAADGKVNFAAGGTWLIGISSVQNSGTPPVGAYHGVGWVLNPSGSAAHYTFGRSHTASLRDNDSFDGSAMGFVTWPFSAGDQIRAEGWFKSGTGLSTGSLLVFAFGFRIPV